MADTCSRSMEGYNGNDDKHTTTAEGQQRFLSRGLHNYTQARGDEAGDNRFSGHLHRFSYRNFEITQEEYVQ